MFTGFTDQTMEFLWGIRLNNDRAWFHAHKQIYLDSVHQPMTEFADEIFDFLRKKRPNAGFMRRVTRIYRDARRLFGRGPYKDSLWFNVEQPSEGWTGKPTFWFEIAPDYWSYGLGYWRPAPVIMAKMRGKITREPEVMEKFTRKLKRSKEFRLDTVDYRRPKAPAPSEILTPWYQARSISIIHEETWTEELYSRAIMDRVKKGCVFLLPYYDWFAAVDAEPDPATRNPHTPLNDILLE